MIKYKIYLLIILLLLVNFTSLSQEAVKTFYKSGVLKSIYYKKGGKLNGEYKAFYADGSIKEEGKYKNDLKNGVFKSHYKNGKGELVEKFYNGVEVDTIFRFNEDQSLDIIYDVNTSLWKKYYTNGTLKEQGVYESKSYKARKGYKSKFSKDIFGGISINIEKEGEWNYYNSTGDLVSKINYVRDKKEGIAEFYYSNGNLKTLLRYKKDFLEGLALTRYENGTLYSEGNFKNNQQQGAWKYYYDNSKRDTEFIYDMGLLKEVKYKYLYNGNKVDCGDLKNGNGSLIIYDEQGKILELKNYKGGKLSK